jgi:YD repeat-containing protein
LLNARRVWLLDREHLTSITDANSNQTAFTYDACGRVTKTTFPSALSETYQRYEK